jgi:hypothetical protein
MSAAFPPRTLPEQAADWLRRRLEWEDILDALRAAERGERPTARPRQREPAAA